MFFKAKNKLLPHNLQQFFATKYDSMHVTCQSKKIKYEYARTTLKYMCMSVYGVKLWNSNDENITSAAAVQVLKKYLSTYFFMVTMVTIQTRNSKGCI